GGLHRRHRRGGPSAPPDGQISHRQDHDDYWQQDSPGCFRSVHIVPPLRQVVDRFATGSYLFETRALTVRRRLHFVRIDPKFDPNNTSILTDSEFSNNKIRFEEFEM